MKPVDREWDGADRVDSALPKPARRVRRAMSMQRVKTPCVYMGDAVLADVIA